MNENKAGHTPGPWKIAPNGNGFIVYGIAGMGPPIVETHEAAVIGRAEADAALIAAAPNLLRALQAMLHGLRVPTSQADYDAEREEACALARAALAKANAT